MTNAMRAVVTLKTQSGVPDDAPRNVFHFNQLAAYVAADATNITTALGTFYNACYPYFANMLVHAANNLAINFYDDLTTGPPLFTTTGSAASGAINAQDLPLEVAAVLSIHSNYTGVVEFGPTGAIKTPDQAQDFGAPPTHTGRTRPKATYRGRIYLGPLNTAALTTDPTKGGIIIGAFQTALKNGATALLGTRPDWSQLSRSAPGIRSATLVGGWISDRPGSTRRRRVEEVVRVTWP